jgi:hypothetical protein
LHIEKKSKEKKRMKKTDEYEKIWPWFAHYTGILGQKRGGLACLEKSSYLVYFMQYWAKDLYKCSPKEEKTNAKTITKI